MSKGADKGAAAQKPASAVTKLTTTVKMARKRGVPLLALQTADQFALQAAISEAVNGDSPKITWDCRQGFRALNEPQGTDALGKISTDPDVLAGIRDLEDALPAMLRLPAKALIFVHNAQLFMQDARVIQGIANLRDAFKADERTLVLLGTVFQMPAELHNDVVMIEDPLPSDEDLARTIAEIHQYVELKPPTGKALAQAIAAVRGLSAFGVEQIVSMSITKSGLDLEELWERKRMAVSQQKGLTLTRGGVKLDELGGLKNAIGFVSRIFADDARRRPEAVVFIDEIEKHLAGATGIGDNTGISQDALGVILRWMEDHGADGMILLGPGGSGKTAFGTAISATFNVPRITFDLGAMKGSLVGESEKGIRDAIRTIDAIASSRAFVIATCNKLEVLPPELRRRFRSGIWYFDIPTEGERDSIWKIHTKKYGIEDVRPSDTDWTGAEIRNCCDHADRLGITPREAAEYVVPIMKSDPQSVERLRELAHGRFLSASEAGAYTKLVAKPSAAAGKGARVISIADVES